MMLVLGATGQIGRELERALATHAPVLASRSGCLAGNRVCERIDLADSDTMRSALDRIAPRIIINAAAHTAVDRAEDESALAVEVNHQAVATLAAWAAEHAALLVHFSTDYVFAGDATVPYREEDVAAPASAYGQSKWAGEQAVRDSGCAHLILRTAWIYAAHGHNFLRSILRAANAGKPLRVVVDQFGTPTSARFVAGVVARLLAQPAAHAQAARRETLHVTCAGQTSWHGFASYLLERAAELKLISELPAITAIESDAWPTRAARPRYSVLACERIEREHGIARPAWQDEVDATLLEIEAGHCLLPHRGQT